MIHIVHATVDTLRLIVTLIAMSQGEPIVRLRLVPQAEMHNSTELPIILELPDTPPVTVQACSHVVLDWQPMDQRPSCSVVLQSTMACSELKVKYSCIWGFGIIQMILVYHSH